MKTIRVRIAIIVNEHGYYFASGCDRSDDSDNRSTVNDIFSPNVDGAESIHFIEADVPLPEPTTVEGEVVK